MHQGTTKLGKALLACCQSHANSRTSVSVKNNKPTKVKVARCPCLAVYGVCCNLVMTACATACLMLSDCVHYYTSLSLHVGLIV